MEPVWFMPKTCFRLVLFIFKSGPVFWYFASVLLSLKKLIFGGFSVPHEHPWMAQALTWILTWAWCLNSWLLILEGLIQSFPSSVSSGFPPISQPCVQECIASLGSFCADQSKWCFSLVVLIKILLPHPVGAWSRSWLNIVIFQNGLCSGVLISLWALLSQILVCLWREWYTFSIPDSLIMIVIQRHGLTFNFFQKQALWKRLPDYIVSSLKM